MSHIEVITNPQDSLLSSKCNRSQESLSLSTAALIKAKEKAKWAPRSAAPNNHHQLLSVRRGGGGGG